MAINAFYFWLGPQLSESEVVPGLSESLSIFLRDGGFPFERTSAEIFFVW
jgi:hypothetical protein